MVPQDELWHQNWIQMVGNDIVDTSTKFDAILICRSKIITGLALSLSSALIDTIIATMMDFFITCYFYAFL